MEAKAVKKYAKQSARKLRQVADLVRGKDLEDVLNTLHFSRKKSSRMIEKTVRSCVANMMNTDEGAAIEPEDLYLKEIVIDEGPTMKRYRPRAMGRATEIRKRSSHITVKLATKE
ncbi:MAG: 50S ribosomal protein L22 [Candidatus Marinimicrobia bacterium]|nr:50S ribosomal protein L22 [Candidatus Neomarinimicrobiota bacterium]